MEHESSAQGCSRDAETGPDPRPDSASRQEDGADLVRFTSTRFGDVAVPVDLVIEFPGGLLGFPDQERFVILQNPSGGPFQWLHSIDEPGLAFVVADPCAFFTNYEVPVSDEEQRFLAVEDADDVLVLVILVVPADPSRITANLQGPLVINSRRRVGKQLVLQIPDYTTRHLIFSADRAQQSEVETVETVGGTEC